MRVVFRVDASLDIGSGHVMRCLVLAIELRIRGHEVIFGCTPLSGDMRHFVRQHGFEVIDLAKPKAKDNFVASSPYELWLGKSVAEDARDFVDSFSSIDLLITDHYAIGAEWQRYVASALKCRILALDDLGRKHYADIILDQTLGRSRVDYSTSFTRVLAGSQYALVGRGFLGQREAALARVRSQGAVKILITMGSVDFQNVTLKVLKAMENVENIKVTVLLSEKAPHYEEVRLWCAKKTNFSHFDFVKDMASLMMSHDVAIGAPGSTSWERACIGLPNIIVPLANNQQLVCSNLVKNSVALKVEIDEIDALLVSKYAKLLADWYEFKRSNLITCDARGPLRVVQEIEELMNETTMSVSLKLASEEDVRLVYNWQIDPRTRRFAVNPAEPSWREHKDWMVAKLGKPSDYFYMIVDTTRETKLGVVRLDRLSFNFYIVSIFLDPKSYGKGVALRALKVLDRLHPDFDLRAEVLQDNFASQRLFEKAGYIRIDNESFIRNSFD
jgi:UDP-2,4-diacetamido-2,4,6-trideoxy-beta-L-altropyranose hydrolase